MKKLFVLVLLATATAPAFATDSLDTKMVEKFTVNNPKAENIKWSDNEGRKEVYYTNADVTCHIWFDANGQVIKTRRYYSEKDLAPFLKARINEEFPGKKIFGITENSDARSLNYVITLQDETNWITVKSTATGEMTVTTTLQK